MAKAYKALPPAEVLWDTFDYKPLTGELVRKPGSSKTRPDQEGKVAGSLNKVLNYWVVCVQSEAYYAHRLIWLWMTGTDPAGKQIDHINMDRSDNRWFNLRLATKAQNMCNRRVRGAYPSPWGWVAKIMVNYKSIHLGYYSTQEEAYEAYKRAALKYHGEFARID
jgi:hypothetical protein